MEQQAQTIIKIKQAVKEMEIANAYPNDNSARWVAHLAKVIQLECLKLTLKGY